jgi:hypothetical protein
MRYYEDEELRGELSDVTDEVASLSLRVPAFFLRPTVSLDSRLAWMTTPRPLRRMRLKDRRFPLEGILHRNLVFSSSDVHHQ